MPFLIIAGVIFAVALAWKYLGNHDEKPTTATVKTEVVEPVKINTEKPIKSEPVIEVVEEPQQAQTRPFIEDREVRKKIGQNNMKYAIRYPTFDKAITALRGYRDNGLDQAASDLITYINTTFPNNSIPADLLD
jgi:hypothetical protein